MHYMEFLNRKRQEFTQDKILILFSILLFLPKELVKTPSGGIDPSWQISLSMAVNQGLTFGKDWLFTYGPLGYLSTRYAVYTGIIPLVLLDIFTVAVLIYILRYVFKTLGTLSQCLVVPYFIAMCAHNPETTFQLFTFFVFLICHHYRTNRLMSLILAWCISVLVFYIKLNLGIVTSGILYLYLLWQSFANPKSRITGLTAMGLHLIAIVVSSYFLHVDLPGYLIGSLEIINGYNDAMFTVDHIVWTARYAYFDLALATIILVSLLIFVITSFRFLLKSPSDIFISLLMFFTLFLGFKQGFTRFTISSMPYPFFYGAFFVGIAYLFTENERVKRNVGNLFKVFLLISPLVSSGLGVSYNKISIPYQDLVFSNNQFQHALTDEMNRKEYHINAEITRKLQGKTVDVFPYEISYTYFNDLHYNPRPAIQSYQAYNDYLTTLNYKKYTSPTAPDFILYTLGRPTDVQRYNFWDDAKSTLAMLQNYQYDTTTMSRDTLQVLKKRIQPGKIIKTNKRNITFKMNEPVALSQTGKLNWTSIQVEYSLWGKIVRILAQPPELLVKATFEDGQTRIIKAIIPEIRSGIFLKSVQTNAEAKQFFETSGKTRSITHLEFFQNNAGFKPTITAEVFDLSFL